MLAGNQMRFAAFVDAEDQRFAVAFPLPAKHFVGVQFGNALTHRAVAVVEVFQHSIGERFANTADERLDSGIDFWSFANDGLD